MREFVFVCMCSPESLKYSRIIFCQLAKSPIALRVLLGIFTLTKVMHCSQDIYLSPDTHILISHVAAVQAEMQKKSVLNNVLFICTE